MKPRAPNHSSIPEVVAGQLPAEAFDDSSRSLNPYVGGTGHSQKQEDGCKAWRERKRKAGARFKGLID